jgi:hypothetical protein
MPISLPWVKENAQRKYIDLIKEVSSKWANWDPPKRVRVSLASPRFDATLLTRRSTHRPEISAQLIGRLESSWSTGTYIRTRTLHRSRNSILR